jgi:hypothetical protein
VIGDRLKVKETVIGSLGHWVIGSRGQGNNMGERKKTLRVAGCGLRVAGCGLRVAG